MQAATSEEVLLNSLGEEALGVEDYEITLDFASAGNWGAGTGDANPTQRLLNGTLVARERRCAHRIPGDSRWQSHPDRLYGWNSSSVSKPVLQACRGR